MPSNSQKVFKFYSIRFCCLWIASFFIISCFSTLKDLFAQVPESCLKWFEATGAVRGAESCLVKCQTAEVSLNNFECPKNCKELCKGGGKCLKLNGFATKELRNKNRCKAFVNTVEEAIRQVKGAHNPSREILELLKEVLIGKDLKEGRGQGECFTGTFGSEGFKKELQDKGNQIHHAMAGIYIGYRYGRIGCFLAMLQEFEEQDDKLYEITCHLGYDLNDGNYDKLADRIRTSIGDDSCKR